VNDITKALAALTDAMLAHSAKIEAMECGLNAVIAALCSNAPQAIAPMRQYLELERGLSENLRTQGGREPQEDDLYRQSMESFERLLRRLEENRHQ
jgi:hypothetical protein